MIENNPRDVAIRPQSGPQEMFASCSADIAIFGGSAGGGKTWALEFEPTYHLHNPDFTALFLRRTVPQIRNPGGLWDESRKVYPLLGGKGLSTFLIWRFPSGAYVKMSGLQYEDTVYDFQGSQIPLILFDELTHFTESQFFYMLSRNRSTSGVRPYVRATCNPDASSWVKRFLAPWVDSTFPNPATSGELRYFVRINDTIEWVDREYVGEAGMKPKSVTFIRSSIYDNKRLLQADPGYLHNLMALPYVEKRRLLDGDWDVMPTAGKVFRREDFRIAPAPRYNPMEDTTVRFWDFAGTEKKLNKDDPDYTVGVKMVALGPLFVVVDVIAVQASPAAVDALVQQTAAIDGPHCVVRWEIEPGSGGKFVAHYFQQKLRGYDARGIVPRGDKIQRARAFAQAVASGRVMVANAPWLEAYLTELNHFPEWKHDDRVDASAGAYNALAEQAAAWDGKKLSALRNN